jgi:hypothetical protein
VSELDEKHRKLDEEHNRECEEACRQFRIRAHRWNEMLQAEYVWKVLKSVEEYVKKEKSGK